MWSEEPRVSYRVTGRLDTPCWLQLRDLRLGSIRAVDHRESSSSIGSAERGSYLTASPERTPAPSPSLSQYQHEMLIQIQKISRSSNSTSNPSRDVADDGNVVAFLLSHIVFARERLVGRLAYTPTWMNLSSTP